MTVSSPRRKAVLAFLRFKKDWQCSGPIQIDGFDDDEIVDEVVEMEKEGLVRWLEAPNPNRRNGEIGYIELLHSKSTQTPSWQAKQER